MNTFTVIARRPGEKAFIRQFKAKNEEMAKKTFICHHPALRDFIKGIWKED